MGAFHPRSNSTYSQIETPTESNRLFIKAGVEIKGNTNLSALYTPNVKKSKGALPGSGSTFMNPTMSTKNNQRSKNVFEFNRDTRTHAKGLKKFNAEIAALRKAEEELIRTTGELTGKTPKMQKIQSKFVNQYVKKAQTSQSPMADFLALQQANYEMNQLKAQNIYNQYNPMIKKEGERSKSKT